MKLSPKARLVADAVLVSGIVVLSFLPAVGTQQRHFAIAAGTLRIFAGVYATIVILARRVISKRAPVLLDLTAAATLAFMAWAKRFPAGNHLAEIGLYSAVAAILFVLTLLAVPVRQTAAG